MSRRCGASLVALLTLACASRTSRVSSEPERAGIEREVAAATDSLFAAARRLDADAVFGRFVPGLHTDDGALARLDSLEPAYRALYAATRRLDLRMTRREVRALAPNVALTVAEGTFDATARDGERQQGRAAWTFVWVREGESANDWRVVHQHQSFPAMVEVPAERLASSTSALEAIMRQGTRHAERWRGNDVEGVIALYAPDAALLFPGAPDVRGRTAVRARLTRLFAENRVDSLDVRVDTIEVYGSTAMEWGTYRQVLRPAGQAAVRETGRYLMQWRRQPDGSWAIRRFTGNALPATER